MLERGKLVPPRSLREARCRLQKLRREVAKVEAQIADPTRALRAANMAEYDEWLGRARRAHERLHAEARLLGEWVGERQARAAEWLERAHDLLATLVEEDVDLDEGGAGAGAADRLVPRR